MSARPPYRRVALVPPVLALLPEYAGLDDPVAPLRAAAEDAVRWLAGGGGFAVEGSDQGRRIAAALAASAGVGLDPASTEALLVLGNGSARRTEKAPGHLDDRAQGFDAVLLAALRDGDADVLGRVDRNLADELWAEVEPLRRLAVEVDGFAGTRARIDYDDDPHGVAYWVMRWELG